ncbi:hypothetical protein [Propionibacterium freudenreichii]|uniref:hypothetical protein n=1 Tax=Propionibacterium freudenreichii TaxID=1744 RepID=UPI00288C2576|nr:hypothetical protein [Propionibacterium freudenreichii]
MLVVVVAVQRMAVIAMDVVDVVAVLHGRVAAARAVLVFGDGVLCACVLFSHDCSFRGRIDQGSIDTGCIDQGSDMWAGDLGIIVRRNTCEINNVPDNSCKYKCELISLAWGWPGTGAWLMLDGRPVGAIMAGHRRVGGCLIVGAT